MDVDAAIPLILLTTLVAIGVFFLYLGVTKKNRATPDEPVPNNAGADH